MYVSDFIFSPVLVPALSCPCPHLILTTTTTTTTPQVLPKPLKIEMIEAILQLMETEGPVSRCRERKVIAEEENGDKEVKKLVWKTLLDLQGAPVPPLV